MFGGFLARAGVYALASLGFTVWWLTDRRVGGRERLVGFGAAVAGGVLCLLLSHTTVIPVSLLMMSLPWVFTAWAVWLLAARRGSARTRRSGLVTVLGLTWGVFLLIRMDGLGGGGEAVLRWRWSPVAEDQFLRELRQRDRGGAGAHHPLSLQAGDWPGFRGPDRDGIVRGVRIATDWNTAPPRLIWRHRVGPGWSSIAVVGDRLFTQEQRGDSEAVVCFDDAGREVWVHEDAARFSERLAGAGPRATPTFWEGRLYTLGATGKLNCLDAATGARQWSRDIAADSGAKVPLWGFVSSPLVVGDVVVVFAGGEGPNQLLAFRAESGAPAWTAAAGKMSYSSAQLASIDGEPQVLFFSNRGLTAVDPASGAVLWDYGVAGGGPALPRTLQPQPVGGTQVLIGSDDFGTALIDVTRGGGTWDPAQRWASRALRPSFNDWVVHDGCVYGFDASIFCCIDLETGKPRWKGGRYGKGQALLLADQALLLVISEEGVAVLLAANRDRHEELGRFQAINGKTWNHPVIARGRLYVRNGEEMACYELGSAVPR
jgi:outer membrane protein assembly factor BamB